MENLCYHCGGKDYLSQTCHTPKHLVELYQESLKNKVKKMESNFAYEGDCDYGQLDINHLDVADHFADQNGLIDYLIGDQSV